MAALAGCASYEHLALDKESRLVAPASELEGFGGKVTLAALDRLVVLYNPDLWAARAKLGVGAAQVIQAGILPNPQADVTYPFVIAGPGAIQNVKSILLLDTKREAAQNAASQIYATLLWQEWQTIGKARLLFVDIVSGERTNKLLEQSRRFLRERFDLTNTAINQGNATLATLSPDLVALSDIENVSDSLERLQLSRRHQLNALLGLAPTTKLALVAPLDVPHIDSTRLRGQLVSLPDRRPDLVALQYGYRSEDAKVREAILSQFPNLSVGVASVGTGNTISSLIFGPHVTMDIPIFDRNQGGVALEQATREQLYREFNARISAATGEIGALLSEQALLSRQLAQLEPRLKEARMIAEKATAAFTQRTLDERAYVDIEVAHLTREREKIGLQQAMLEGQVGLATLVGAGMPQIEIEPEVPRAGPFGGFPEENYPSSARLDRRLE
ncbi:TolC family protein [Bradyrhizobium sp.]|uniref:TolC family protein n=1 Tax=Bradyrhizobium sp. TaxID=376 RepID=UPI00261C2BF2|nr:TolC family protein [Bradyrhizobium sp.]